MFIKQAVSFNNRMVLVIGVISITFLIYTAKGFRKLTVDENNQLQKQCGISNFQGVEYQNFKNFKIIYGDNTNVGDFPWAVRIFFTNSKYQKFIECTGSFISPWHVITAAHCIEKRKLMANLIIGGATCVYKIVKQYFPWISSIQCNDSKGIKVIKGIEYIVPKGATVFRSKGDSDTVYTDFAIIELNESISYGNIIRPICLPSRAIEELPEGDLAIAYGFGRTEKSLANKKNTGHNTVNNELKWLLLKKCNLTKTEECSPMVNRKICIPYTLEYCPIYLQNMCYGDSGGGLERIIKQKHILYGVVQSKRNEPCLPENAKNLQNSIIKYAKLDIYIEFICHHAGVCPLGLNIQNTSDGIGAIYGSFFKGLNADEVYSHRIIQQNIMKKTEVPSQKAIYDHFDRQLSKQYQSTGHDQVPQSSSYSHASLIFVTYILLLAAFYTSIFTGRDTVQGAPVLSLYVCVVKSYL